MNNPTVSTPRPRRTRAAKARKTPNHVNSSAPPLIISPPADDPATTITHNWNIANINACVPKALWPKQHGDASQWGDDLIELLRQASSVPGTSNRDFRTKLRTAIQARQARNTSKKGKVGYMTATDVRAVLRMYTQEIGTPDKVDEPQSQSQSQPQPKDLSLKPIAPAHLSPTDVPLTPANPPTPSTAATSPALDASQNAPRAPISGKHIWGVRIPVTRVDFTASTSPASSPARPRRTRNRTRNKNKTEETAAPPVQVDPDPRDVDDTGFVSDLDGGGEAEGEKARPRRRKRKQRLSRLQQERITVPAWTRDVEDVGDGEMKCVEEGMEKVVL